MWKVAARARVTSLRCEGLSASRDAVIEARTASFTEVLGPMDQRSWADLS